MKVPYSRLIILSAAWMILGSAMPAHRSASHTAKQTMYYWYTSDTDLFLEYNSTAGEIVELENMTGLLVNTQPGGGKLIANGYINNTYPHNFIPSVQLYTH